MENIKNHIDNQIDSNRSKNLFFNDVEKSMKFIETTIEIFSKINFHDLDSKESIIEYTIDKVLSEFCRINQYYYFDTESINKLREIYKNLFEQLQLEASVYNTDELTKISQQHYTNLKNWLLKYNSFAEAIYNSEQEFIEHVACSEYSAELQIKLLHIDLKKIQEPILDIGCGSKGELVSFFRNHGFEAYGIDRLIVDKYHCENADWMEYKYDQNKWGTIISNLGFSNHFKHHHLRLDGNYLSYAKKYIEILNSLKPNGKFYYAPDLPFIESYLDNNNYHIQHYNIQNLQVNSVIVEKLK